MHKLHDIHYLDIGPITMNDNGEMKCQISNRAGDEQSIVHLWVVRKTKKNQLIIKFQRYKFLS